MGLEEIRKLKEEAGQPKEKKIYRIPAVSKKRAERIAAEKIKRGDDPTELQKFFKNAMRYMTGRCAETGARTNRVEYRYAINSICHILSQQQCPSVATHPFNWIELEEGFHTRFDKMNWDERAKLKCWPKIQEKLIMVWPDLAPDERRHFPDDLRKFMESDYPVESPD